MEIKEYNEFEAKLAGLEDICNFLPDCSNDEGYEKSKRVKLDVGKVLTALENKRKEIKAPALDRCKFIDSEAKDLKARIELAQLPHKDAVKAIDDDKKRIEEEQVERTNQRFATLYATPEQARSQTAAQIGYVIDSLGPDLFIDCQEKTSFALIEKERIIGELQVIMADTAKLEQEKIELAKLREAEEKRQRKEREDNIAKQAANDARIEAEQKAEGIRLETERAAKAERQQLEKAERDALEAKESAEREVEAAKVREQQAKEKAERDTELALQAERDRVEQEKQAEIVAAKKREASTKHQAKINNEAMEDLVAGGLNQDQAKLAVTLLAQRKVRHSSISY